MHLYRSSTKDSLAYPTHLYSRQDFSHFYDSYAPMLYGYLLGRNELTSVAEAILADVFVTFWQERAAFNEHQSKTINQAPLRWLLSIAHRKELEP
jgi:DNA-directed RNA polymerase specialized sigma24 family protein